MICIDCVSSEPLKRLFNTDWSEGDCSYCQRFGRIIPKSRLFDHIYRCVEENVATEDDLTSYELTMLYDCGSDIISISTLDLVLAEWFELDDEPYFDELYNAAPAGLGVDDEGRDIHFYYDNGTLEKNIYEDRWQNFVDDIHYQHRFFNAEARHFLESAFSLLLNRDNQLKEEVVRVMRPGEQLYRARGTRSIEETEEIICNPAGQFGLAPKHLTGNQRMTPSGISALYCALERETCLSEIRSITGDSVVSAALTPIDGLRLLDLTSLSCIALPKLMILDEGWREAHHLKAFLGSLVKKMSQPKARDNELSYLSTQVVFEYFRKRFGDFVDGLVLPSVQTGERGTNIVLFPEASRLSYVPPAQDYQEDELVQIAVPPVLDNFFETPTKLEVVPGSFRFHKVVAIETKSIDYQSRYELYMSDTMRKY